MEEHTIVVAAQWVGSVIALVLTGFGVNKLTLAYQKRKYEQEDKMEATRDAAHVLAEGNNANKLSAQIDITELLVARVTALETNQNHLNATILNINEKLNTSMTQNATLTANNAHLVKENERQAGEIIKQADDITELRGRNRELTQKVFNLTTIVTKLETQIAILTGTPLPVTIVDSEGHPTDSMHPLEVHEADK